MDINEDIVKGRGEKSKTKPLIKRKISNMREDQGKKIVFD